MGYGLDASKAKFEMVTVLDQPMLFTCCRVDRDTVPESSNCAGMYLAGKATRFHLFFSVCFAFSGSGTERKTVCYNRWAAPSGAITGNRHNDTPV